MNRFKGWVKRIFWRISPTYRHSNYILDEIAFIRKSQLDSAQILQDYLVPTLDKDGIYTKVAKLYVSLADQQSKDLFLAKLNSSLTGNIKPLFEHLAFMERDVTQRDLLTIIRDNITSQKDTLILASGGTAQNLKTSKLINSTFLKLGLSFSFIINDGDFGNPTKILDIPCITSKEATVKSNEGAIIIVPKSDVKVKLIKNGCKKENVVLKKTALDIQYFDKDILPPKKNEVFIDGGSFNLQDSINFNDWCSGNYKAIYAFEPDNNNFSKFESILNKPPFTSNSEKTHRIINKGLHSESGRLVFSHGRGASSSLKVIDKDDSLPAGVSMVNVTSIDDILRGKKATFIKLDIEGAELEALKGAKNTIVKHNPRMAIAIYHKNEDILEIPLYILSLNPNYKFFLRHYSTWKTETILYCVL